MITNVLKKCCISIDKTVMLFGYFSSLLMPVLAVTVGYEVFSRYVLNAPTIWAYDMSLFMFGYIAVLGGAYAQQKRAHINVDIFYLKVSRKTRAVFNLVSHSLGMFFLLLVIYLSLGKYQESVEFDYRRQGEWAPPMYHFWIMIIIGASLFIAQLCRDSIAELYYLITGNPLLDRENGNGN